MRQISAVYFIDAGSKAVKIGMTENVSRVPVRIATLQTGNHEELRLVGLIRFVERSGDGPSARTVEGALHAALADDRLCGEWFRWSAGLLDIIETYSDPVPDCPRLNPARVVSFPPLLDEASRQIEARQLLVD